MIRRRADWVAGAPLLVVVAVVVVIVVVAAAVGVCRGRQGGGHRVKMREDPPSGARTLIDFLGFLSPSRPCVLESIHAHIAFRGCLLSHRGVFLSLSLYLSLPFSTFLSFPSFLVLRASRAIR